MIHSSQQSSRSVVLSFCRSGLPSHRRRGEASRLHRAHCVPCVLVAGLGSFAACLRLRLRLLASAVPSHRRSGHRRQHWHQHRDQHQRCTVPPAAGLLRAHDCFCRTEYTVEARVSRWYGELGHDGLDTPPRAPPTGIRYPGRHRVAELRPLLVCMHCAARAGHAARGDGCDWTPAQAAAIFKFRDCPTCRWVLLAARR